MRFHVVGVRGEQLKILLTVILFVAVPVMHNFSWFQISPNHRLDNESVFSHVSVTSGIGMTDLKDEFVSMLDDVWSSTKGRAASPRTELTTATHRVLPATVQAGVESCAPAWHIIKLLVSTGRAAKVLTPVEFTLGSIHRPPTTYTWHSRASDRLLFGRRGTFSPHLRTNYPLRCSTSITGPTAVNIGEFKSAGRVINFMSALRTVTNHAANYTTWKVTDLGHFEGLA